MEISVGWLPRKLDLGRIAEMYSMYNRELRLRDLSFLDAVFDLQELWDSGDRYVIASEGKRDIGFGSVSTANSEYKSTGVYVLPEFRRKGIGEKIKMAQIENGILNGESRMGTFVKIGNLPSIKLQTKIGGKIARSSDHTLEYSLRLIDVENLNPLCFIN
jgi:GNAT superfamily N-acetyltransferase